MFGSKSRLIKRQKELIESLQASLTAKDELDKANNNLIKALKDELASLQAVRHHLGNDLNAANTLRMMYESETIRLKAEVTALNNKLYGIREPTSLDLALSELLARSNAA